MNQIDLNLIEM